MPGAIDKLKIDEVACQWQQQDDLDAAEMCCRRAAGAAAPRGCASPTPARWPPGTWSTRRATTATLPASAIKNGLEIVRDYTDAKGNTLDRITLGQEIDVHVKIRATGSKGVGNVAIVDLLPGGFEHVVCRSTGATRCRANVAGSTWSPAIPTCAKTAW